MWSMWKLFSWLVATSGLVWQIYFICAQYFLYPTTAEITFKIPQTLQIPTMMVYFNVPLDQRFSDNTITVKKVFDKWPPTAGCRIGNVAKSSSLRDGVRYSCITNETHDSEGQGVKSLNAIWFNLTFKAFAEADTIAVAVEHRIPLDVSAQSMLTVKSSGANSTGSIFRIAYDFILVTRLEHPYSSCFDYLSHRNVRNSDECIVQCLRDEMLIKMRFWIGGRTFADEHMVGRYPDMQIVPSVYSLNDTMLDMLTPTIEHCQRRCIFGEPCVEEFFSIFELERVFVRWDGWDELVIELHTSNRPFTYSVHKKLITVVDLVVYVLGSFAFWLGVAPLSLMLSMPQSFNRTNKSFVTKQKHNRAIRHLAQTQKAQHDHLVAIMQRIQSQLNTQATG